MNTNELQLCSYMQAKQLREAGFNWPTSYYYDTVRDATLRYSNPNNHNDDAQYSKNEWGMYTSVPTVAHALKWFRDVKKIQSGIDFGYHYGEKTVIFYGSYRSDKGGFGLNNSETYESAESELLDKLLKLIEDGQAN